MDDNVTAWNLILPMVKFAYNSSVNRFMGQSPFEVVMGIQLHWPELASLLLNARLSEAAEAFAQHAWHPCRSLMQDWYEQWEIQECHSWTCFMSFDEGDLVMGRLCPERFPTWKLKRLWSKSIGPFKIIYIISANAYIRELPKNWGISHTFNVEDLNLYHGHHENESYQE